MRTTPVSRAYRTVTVRDAGTIQSQLQEKPPADVPARLILEAVQAQYDGSPGRLVALLKRAYRMASPQDRIYVVDLLAPILVMQGNVAESLEYFEDVPRMHELAAPLFALRAVMHTLEGSHESAAADGAEALRLLEQQTDTMLTGRTLQRLAYAAYYSGNHELASERAIESATLFRMIDAPRSAAASYSIAYNVHILTDAKEAYRFAGLVAACASLSGDASFEMQGLVAQYMLAAESGDRTAVAQLRAAINRHPLPQQYRERLGRGIADALASSWQCDFATMRATATLLRESVAETPGERALCLAVASVAELALGEASGAARSARSAIALATLRTNGDSAHEMRYRHFARAVAGAACVLLGDRVRGRRALAARGLRSSGLSALLAVADGAKAETVPESVRGYALALSLARETVLKQHLPVGLTSNELAILQMLADGMSAPAIAVATRRSPHTVRAHTRSIIGKFQVHGRGAAIAQARKLGLLA
jgi:DNA-binding CsgD family transcriptional regulator